MRNRNQWFAAAMMMVSLSPTWAQDREPGMAEATDAHDAQVSREPRMAEATDAHTGHTTPEMVTAPVNHDAHDTVPEMNHDTMPAAAPSSGLRDPHAYANGYDFSQFPMRHEGGGIKTSMLRADRLEAVRDNSSTAVAYEVQAWYGGDFDRAVLKAEGDIDEGKLQEGRTELLWSHAVAAFWDAQLGLRYDSGMEPDRHWLALGIQGLAPYWFEVNASAYVGDEGRSALRLGAEYEVLLTQKLIVQPRLEADFYGKRDAGRALGSGLSELSAGLRLRYEIRREFAPYIGVAWTGKYGDTADYARAAGEEAMETQAVAGLRFWF